MQDAGEDQQEIFEWWFVSSWLYERLRDEGEPVINSDYGYLWDALAPVKLSRLIP
jgi:hypothetical protein